MEPILATRKGQELDTTKIAIKGYDIIEVVGKGGMGYVCKARQVSMDRLVAIKILNEKFADNPAFVARFISEARSAGKLNHPNVIQVHDVGQYNNVYFFSMEFLEGNTVREILKNKKHMQPVEAIRITIEIAKALDYAHRLGIIHQDIKPDNIMVDKNGQVKLADLGISKVYEENAAVLNEVMGSPHFMSPEQALGKSVDGRSDIYSLGVSLFQMLVGDTPFSGVSIQEILKKHVNQPVPNVRDFNSQVPGKVASVIRKMMEKKPEERYQTANDLIEDLQAVYDRLAPKKGGAKVKLELRKLAKQHASKASKKRFHIIGGLVAAAILLLALAYGIKAMVSGEEPEPVTSVSGNVLPSPEGGQEAPPGLVDAFTEFSIAKNEDIRKARKIGTSIIKQWPEFTNYVERIKQELPRIERQIADQDIAKLNSRYNEFAAEVSGAAPEDVIAKAGEFAQANSRLLQDYAGEPDVKRINSELARLEKEARKKLNEELEQSYQAMKNEVNQFIERNEYASAEQLLAQFKRAHPVKYASQIEQLRAILTNAEEAFYQQTMRSAAQEASKNRLSLAISILKDFIRTQAGRDYVKTARTKLEEYVARLEKLCATVRRTAAAYEAQFQFAAARNEYQALAQQVAYDEQKLKEVNELSKQVIAQITLMDELAKKIKQAAPTQLTFRISPDLKGEILKWNISDADPEKVTIEHKSGIKRSFRWANLSGEAFDRVFMLFFRDAKDPVILEGAARVLELKGMVARARELANAAK
ncbi:MAG: protein kinase [Planctomycetota bacterium]|nr:protein kinase [Planctomycetota bacterium]